MDIVLYSTHCPKCNILEKKLNEYEIPYQTVTDTAVMEGLGIKSAPYLGVNGELLNFSAAIARLGEISDLVKGSEAE